MARRGVSSLRGGEAIVDGEDRVGLRNRFGNEGAGDVVLEPLKGAEDVFGVGAVDVVEQKIGRVEFGPQRRPLGLVSAVHRRIESRGLGQRDHVVGRAGQLQHAVGDPLLERLPLAPRALFGVPLRREYRELFQKEEIEVDTADLLPRKKIEDVTVEIAEHAALVSRADRFVENNQRRGVRGSAEPEEFGVRRIQFADQFATFRSADGLGDFGGRCGRRTRAPAVSSAPRADCR